MKPLLKTVSLKEGMPLVQEAMMRLDRELALGRQQGYRALKIIHGYGSSGVGGEIRMAAQRKLQELVSQGAIRACIFGEDWAISDRRAWALTRAHAELKQDRDLGKKNLGITLVVL